MLNPIATAGSAGVRAFMDAAPPDEALLHGSADVSADISADFSASHHTDTTAHAQPGTSLTQLAAQMPPGLFESAVRPAASTPSDPAVAPPPAPSASPQEIAALELMLADPLHSELLATYAAPPQALGSTGLAPDLVARYGADLASRLDHLGHAQAAVRRDFLQALDAAHAGGPGGPGWVASTVFAVPEDGGPQTLWSFDPDRFAAGYAQGTSLAQRAFATQCTNLLGQGHEPASTTIAAHESADVATTRVAGHFTLSGGGWVESGSENGPGSRVWQAHGLDNNGALALLDPARPPELHQREAVWFDSSLGWVTARENIVVKDGFLDKLAKVSFGVAAAWMVGRLDFLAFGPGTAGQIASQAAVGATTAAVTQLAFTGRLDFGNLLRTALTSGLTAGLAQVPQLQPWLATQPGLALDPARLLGRAGLQGLMQQATGGRFADGALASLANSLAANVGDRLSQGIDTRLQTGELSPAEASAWRLMSQAARSAVAALGHPGDPMAGFAQDYLGGLMAAAEAPANHATVGAPAPQATGSAAPPGPEEVQASANGLGGSLAAASSRGSQQEETLGLFNNGQLQMQDRCDMYTLASAPISPHVSLGGSPDKAVQEWSDDVDAMIRNSGSDRERRDAYLAASTVDASDAVERQLQWLDGTVRGAAQWLHSSARFLNDQGWAAANALSGGWLAENNDAARAAVERNAALGRGLLPLPAEVSVTALRALAGNLTTDEVSQGVNLALRTEEITALEVRGDYSAAQAIRTENALNIASFAVGTVPAARSAFSIARATGETTLLGTRLTMEDFAASPAGQRLALQMERYNYQIGVGGNYVIEPQFTLRLSGNLTTSRLAELAREGHALDRHGGSVTDQQLMTRAHTGVAPDGSSVVKDGQVRIPPSATAFNSDAMLAQADLLLRQDYLDRAVALSPVGAPLVTIEGVDVGAVVGRGYDRVTATPGGVGPLQYFSNLSRVTGVYRYDAASGTWQTVTIYPVKR